MKAHINKMAKGLKLMAALLLLMVANLQAQVVSLQEVLSKIETQNPMLHVYDHKTAALTTYTQGAKSWMAPMVGIGTFMTPYPGQNIMEEGDKGSIMITVEQSIPNRSKQNAAQNYFAARAGVEEQNRAVRYNELRAEAKALYYQWLVLEQKEKVLRENEAAITLMVKLARLRYPYNQGSLGNIYKAEGRLSEVQNMIAMTSGEIEEKSYRLKTLMNVDPETSLMVDTTLTVHFNPDEFMTDTLALRQHRSDIRQLEKTIEVMRLNQQLQRSQARPDFKIRFDHMQPLGNMPTLFTVMGMVSIPIAPWSSSMYKSEVKGMHHDIAAMMKEQEVILLEARGMLQGIKAKLERMQQQLTNYETRILPALQKNYNVVMLAYEENREQLPMVIDAWETLSMAQLECLNRREEFYTMMVNYEKELEK